MSNKNIEKTFSEKLVMNKYLFSLIGIDGFEEIQKYFRDPSLKGINSDGRSKLSVAFIDKYEDEVKIPVENLEEYDLNIIKALSKINHSRSENINLKYFQYFSLLLMEIYLDKYFANKDGLLKELNVFLDHFNNSEDEEIKEFVSEDLNKLALWSATGSGKTLIMHLNFIQIQYYLEKYNIKFDGSFILLTPNEGLSGQHIEEFKKSGITANIYNKNVSKSFVSWNSIEVIENTKLAEKDGDKTVATSRFGSKNIVFVDEGHRGVSGDSWYKFRNELCKDGFSFEYSATFGQAIKASRNKDLEDEYSKCIYFDYSYRYFYNDGYGKDYKILNLETDEDNIRELYLCASLLAFYQQKRLFNNNKQDYREFNIENPLMIYVGGSVNAVRTENKRKVSDVVDILLFLDEFTTDKNKYSDIINRILSERTGLLNSMNIDVFRGDFDYINSLGLSSEHVYDDVLLEVFHESMPDSIMHIEYIKGSDGEIKVRLGNNKPFGLINVGDAPTLINLCKDNGLNTSDVNFTESIFAEINRKDSSINILIGSKKFIEGWNSWRVSTMGLMNIGRTEGSQIIQMFGRGVRLKGRDFSLKRSSAYFSDYPFVKSPDNYSDMKYLETLNIFGVRADYMTQFKEYLEADGIKTNTEKPWTIEIPILKDKNLEKKKVVTLKVKKDLNFKRDGKEIVLGENKEKFIISLDCYGKVQFQSSTTTSRNVINKETYNLSKMHLGFLDYEKIYFSIQRYKGEKNYYNMAITLESIKKLLADPTWYKLYIPEEDLKIKSVRDFDRFNRIAVSLLEKYIDKLYSVSRSRWEGPLLEYSYMNSEDDNLVRDDTYKIEISDQQLNKSHIKFLEDLEKAIGKAKNEGDVIDIREVKGDLGTITLKSSISNPYIYISEDNLEIRIQPMPLKESEWDFINDLKKFLKTNKSEFDDKEVYI
ncbi:DEAD/DEAH box helicase family protein, partial [Gudongella sp. SC589]|uniref:DEAD/DEAH box helicase family protein n=1 Tax=Gudongella sp. SC589 TaxID=3385990 RepID=UPI003904773D